MSHHDPHQPTVQMDEHVDSWHNHTADEGMPQEEHAPRPDSLALVVAFAGSVIIVALVIVVCLLYYGSHTTGLRQERIETTALAADYTVYRDQSDRTLSEYHWASPENAAAGKVTVPIDQAMQRIIDQYNAQGGKR